MKKVLIYLISFILIFFILPAILTTKTRNVSTQIELEENNNKEGKYKKIKLLHSDTNEVEEIDLEEYICNVVSSEMPANYELEALKAQAIVARTYTIYKVNNPKHDNADICDKSTCCQAWISKEDRLSKWKEDSIQENWDKIFTAVNDTKGKIITYNGEPINAFFHSNSGGTTEIASQVWGGQDFPYLQVVQTAGEEGYSQYNSKVTYTHEELIGKLKDKYNDLEINFDLDDAIKILEYTESGRVKTIKFGNHNLSGVETRTILGLKSTNFEILNEEGKVSFVVKGYGHGVGMSQTGADSMAKEGKSAEDIINHFYKNVEIKDINSL